MACIYMRGNVWWVKFHLKGVRVQQSLNTTHERVAQARKSQIEYRLATGTLVVPSETPIGDFLEGFCQYLKSTRTRKSHKNDISYLRIFFGPICRSLEPGNTCNRRKVLRKECPKLQEPLKEQRVRVGLLEELSSEMISQFITRRIQTDGISPRTANRFREVLHKMFAYAIKEKGYTGPDGNKSNPVADVGRRQEPAHSIRFLRIAQIDEQLGVLQDQPTLRALVATFIYGGLRREEALWLTVDDVDLDKRLIYVRAKLINGEHWQPKTKRNRVVPISSALHEIFATYSPERTEPWFFPSPRGRRRDPDNTSQELREINRSHGLKWSCLDFRHTFGSTLAQMGRSLFQIAELMGNSPEICRRHYAALMPEKMHDVVEFNPGTSPTADKTEVMLQQILEKLDRKEPASAGPKLRLIRTAGEEVAS
jgi:integrase